MTAIEGFLAAVALGSGLLLGEIGGRIVRHAMGRPRRSDAVRANARAGGSFVFWAATAVGLILAVGILDREVLDELADRIADDLPRLLLAFVMVIIGWAVGVAVGAAVGQSALRASGVRQPALERVLRVTILLAAVVLALNQLGVDATVLSVLLVAVVGAPALALALLTAAGAAGVASQLAAGRALRPQLREGWVLCVGDVEGRIVGLHPTSVELMRDDGSRVHVPNRDLLDGTFKIRS